MSSRDNLTNFITTDENYEYEFMILKEIIFL